MKKYYNIPYAFYVSRFLGVGSIVLNVICSFAYEKYIYLVFIPIILFISVYIHFMKKINYIIFDEDKFKIKVCFFKKNGEHPYDDVKKVVIEGVNVHCGLSDIFLHFEDKKDIVRFYSNKKLIMEVIRRFPDRISIEGNYVRHQIEKIKKEMDNK